MTLKPIVSVKIYVCIEIENEDKWEQNQQKLLEMALQQFPRSSSERWDKIAKCVPGKTKVPAAIFIMLNRRVALKCLCRINDHFPSYQLLMGLCGNHLCSTLKTIKQPFIKQFCSEAKFRFSSSEKNFFFIF